MQLETGSALRNLLVEDAGATATEYAVMLVLILLVAFGTIIFLGQRVDDAFNTFATMFANAAN